MRKLKLFIHCTLLATTPSLLAYPEYPPSKASTQKVNSWGDWCWDSEEKTEEWVCPTTYDEIINVFSTDQAELFILEARANESRNPSISLSEK